MGLHWQTAPVIRVFVSSPGDVADERGLARAVVDSLPRDDRALRGRVALELVAWDQGPVPLPMLADRTPQASVNAGMPRPSECDIVVVILWGRIGTPLSTEAFPRPDGSAYDSGTDWEFADAMEAARRDGSPLVLVYRRTSPVVHDLRASDLEERRRQLALVDRFFDRLTDPSSRAILQGVNAYETPDQFRRMLQEHLGELVHRLIGPSPSTAAGSPHHAAVPAGHVWQGSPFPGLRAFTSIDAPIYVGRGRETDTLVARVAEHSFVAVVGASGSGKSSLVGAGLIPRLAAGALPGSDGWLLPEYEPRLRQWVGLHLTPGELGGDPFLAFAQKLAPLLDERVRDVATVLSQDPGAAVAYLRRTLPAHVNAPAALIVVDQFEELFTVTPAPLREGFAAMVDALSTSGLARVVVTLRADFYARALELPASARLLAQGHLPLTAPSDGLFDMITRPATRAGLEFDEGLPARILAETGHEPGALPLLAYTLDELYRLCAGQKRLTVEAYESLGGVSGAIGSRAEDVFENRLDDAARASFARVFGALVDVDEHRHVTRRRVPLAVAARDPDARRLVEVLTDARLLEQGSGLDGAPIVYVAHEALFSSWGDLRLWIDSAQADLRLLNRVRSAAREWDENGRAGTYLWPQERLDAVDAAVARLSVDLDDAARAFVRPEYERLFPVLRDPATEDYRRQAIADRLAEMGPAVLPGLLDAVTDPLPDVRTVAAHALARLGVAAVAGLAEHLDDRDPEVRMAAIAALRRIGDPSSAALLLPLLSDDDTRVRSMAAGALEAYGGETGAKAAAAAAAGGDVDGRWRAAGNLGSLGASGVPHLLDLMSDQSPRVREAARRAMRAVGPAATAPLVAALAVRGPRGSAAVVALADCGESVIPDLLDAAEDVDLRSGVREALRAMGPAAVPRLLDGATREAGNRLAVLTGALLDIATPAALFGLVERGLFSSDALLVDIG